MRTKLGTLGAALAIGAVALLVVPSALSGGGKDAVSFYTNGKGNVIKKVGEDEIFNIVGKNLDKTVEVFCFAGDAADDLDGIGDWDTLTDWSFGPTSKMLIDGDMDSDCDGNNGVGLKSAIMVEFEHGVVADPTDDVFVIGPSIFVKDEQKA